MKITSDQLTAMGYGPDGNKIRVDAGTPVTGAAREADLHADILAICRRQRWPVVHSRMDVPQTAGIGTPDFVIALPRGRVVWIEAKAANGKIRPEQAAWIMALKARGHIAGVVRSVDDFMEAIRDAQERQNAHRERPAEGGGR